GPGDLAGGDEGVEILGAIAADTRREDLGFQDGCGQRRALQIFNYVQQGIEAAARLHDSLPTGEETRQDPLIDGLDFFAEASERFAANGAQHFGVTPLAMDAAGTEASFDD